MKTRPVACEEGLVHQSRGDADRACSPARRPGTAMGAGWTPAAVPRSGGEGSSLGRTFLSSLLVDDGGTGRPP